MFFYLLKLETIIGAPLESWRDIEEDAELVFPEYDTTKGLKSSFGTVDSSNKASTTST
jgi:hypothetical protein